jgi:uncharacterized RmlC-like cupin family protein
MAAVSDAEVRVVGPAGDYLGKQGLTYATGITSETAGTSGVCLTSLTIPPGARARVHYHEDIETVAYILDGEVVLWYGERVERRVRVRAGEYLYVPANVPHAPENDGHRPCRAVVGHSAGDDQAGIVMLPELDAHLAAMAR